MTLRDTLRRAKKSVRGRRWIIKRTANNSIREVKMIFNPEEYARSSKSRKLHTDKQLLKELDTHHEKFVRNK